MNEKNNQNGIRIGVSNLVDESDIIQRERERDIFVE